MRHIYIYGHPRNWINQVSSIDGTRFCFVLLEKTIMDCSLFTTSINENETIYDSKTMNIDNISDKYKIENKSLYTYDLFLTKQEIEEGLKTEDSFQTIFIPGRIEGLVKLCAQDGTTFSHLMFSDIGGTEAAKTFEASCLYDSLSKTKTWEALDSKYKQSNGLPLHNFGGFPIDTSSSKEDEKEIGEIIGDLGR